MSNAIKPVAWLCQWQDWHQFHSEAFDPLPVEWDHAPKSVTPLYDQATLDAAIAAERDRCAKVCEDGDARQWGYVETTSDLREALAAAIRKPVDNLQQQ